MLKAPFIFLIRLYQKILSPLKPPSCRFTPTCSNYAIEAIKEWGIIIGLALALWRILRCNPFSKGGYDPVPRRKRKRRQNEKQSADEKSATDQTEVFPNTQD
ncbi:MAG: membrane protein insertion efficiency factor YidD [Ruminococcaceae bacterium]|nr:membrane protein insertion efficiency factor YidD [Oscillospiraceae bacterium]